MLICLALLSFIIWRVFRSSSLKCSIGQSAVHMWYSNTDVASEFVAFIFLVNDSGDDHITDNLLMYSLLASRCTSFSSCVAFSYLLCSNHLPPTQGSGFHYAGASPSFGTIFPLFACTAAHYYYYCYKLLIILLLLWCYFCYLVLIFALFLTDPFWINGKGL